MTTIIIMSKTTLMNFGRSQMRCSTHCVVDQNDDDDGDDGYNNHDDYIHCFHDLGDDYNHECLILNTIALITLMKQRWLV